jgi:hypothetical protein
MKKIDITKMMQENNFGDIDRREILGMEFIKQTNGTYLIKNSNGRIVSEKEKIQLENKELVLEDIKKDCAKDITKKISKNKKRIKEIEEKENVVLEETNSTME